METETLLRPAGLGDIPKIIQLYTETVLTVCRADYERRQLQTWSRLGQDESRWRKRIAEQYFLIAERGGEMAGFASLDSENYLDVLYVSSDFQRMRVASVLFEAIAVRSLLNPGKAITADVSKTAKPFFESKGFIVSREQENRIEGVTIVNYRMQLPGLPPGF